MELVGCVFFKLRKDVWAAEVNFRKVMVYETMGLGKRWPRK